MASTTQSPSGVVGIVLVCGYRGHGKDTFFRYLAGHTDVFKFDFFATSFGNHSNLLRGTIERFERIALADFLKHEVAEELGVTMDYLDENKAKRLDEDGIVYAFEEVIPEDPEHPTYRDVLIDRAALRRSEDLDHYVKLAYHEITTNERFDGAIAVITDWRYENEYSFFSDCQRIGVGGVTTVRAHNPNGVVPHSTVMSEHQLDGFATNLLVQPQGTHLEERFIQQGYFALPE